MKALVLSLPFVLVAGIVSAQVSAPSFEEEETVQLPAPSDVTASASSSEMGAQSNTGEVLTALDVATSTTTTTTK